MHCFGFTELMKYKINNAFCTDWLWQTDSCIALIGITHIWHDIGWYTVHSVTHLWKRIQAPFLSMLFCSSDMSVCLLRCPPATRPLHTEHWRTACMLKISCSTWCILIFYMIWVVAGQNNLLSCCLVLVKSDNLFLCFLRDQLLHTVGYLKGPSVISLRKRHWSVDATNVRIWLPVR